MRESLAFQSRLHRCRRSSRRGWVTLHDLGKQFLPHADRCSPSRRLDHFTGQSCLGETRDFNLPAAVQFELVLGCVFLHLIDDRWFPRIGIEGVVMWTLEETINNWSKERPRKQ